MAKPCRLFKSGSCIITQKWTKQHGGIDLVANTSNKFDYVVAHSKGTVIAIRNNCKKTYMTSEAAIKDYGDSYGNYVLIKHSEKCYTMYAHLKYKSVQVKVGNVIKKGQVIGYMGNTGHSSGAHLHFEFRTSSKWNTRKDCSKYINGDLPIPPTLANAGLVYGSTGIQVINLQNDLNYVMKSGLTCDGSFGNETLKALKNFQKKYKLTVDGSYGIKSREKMKSLLK